MTLPTSPERDLTRLDHARLSALLTRDPLARALPADLVDDAWALLDTARVVNEREVAPDVVTMRSRLRLQGDRIGALTVTLAYPSEADSAAGRVSVLTPLGLRLLGARVGEEIAWRGPGTPALRGRVVDLDYQPEASGDFLV